MSPRSKAAGIIFFWVLIQICICYMRKISGNKIYPIWANIIAALMTICFIYC